MSEKKNILKYKTVIKKIILTPLLIILMTFSSCNYLDIEPVGIVTPTSVEELGQLLIGNVRYWFSHRSTIMMTDEMTVFDEDFNGLLKIAQNGYTWSPVYAIGDRDLDWRDKYQVIYNTNYVLSLIDEANLKGSTEEDRRRVKAEALTIRANEYFELVNIYGAHYNANTAATDMAVPLLLTDDLIVTLPRASVAAIYEQVTSDLLTAIGLYSSESLPAVRINASKTGTEALLSRVYLYQGNWQAAAEYADLTLKNYSTLYNYNDYDRGTSATVKMQSAEDNVEAVFYRRSTASYTRALIVKINDDLLALFEPADKRADFFIGTDADGNAIYAPIDPNSVSPANGYFTPEIYLNRAEANARLGNINEAMEDLKIIRENRFDRSAFADQAAFEAAITLTAATIEEAIQQVLEERRRELMLCGLRWFDMKRLADEGRYNGFTRVLEGVTYDLVPGSDQWVVDISPDIKEWNPNLD